MPGYFHTSALLKGNDLKKKKSEAFVSKHFTFHLRDLSYTSAPSILPSFCASGLGRKGWEVADGRLTVAQFGKQLLTFGSHLSADSVYTCLSSSVPYVSM